MKPSSVLRLVSFPLLSLLASAALAGCSTERDTDTTPDPDDGRPDGPAAHVAGLLTGGKGVSLASAKQQPLPDGWVEEEYAVDGTAVSFTSDDLPVDGQFDLHEDASAEYRTRIVVRRPKAAAGFNGTVVVEWLNVSGGFDANPDFAYLADELYRGGYAWVGVSAQYVGIEGGDVLVSTPVSEQAGAGLGLRAFDPERYESLHHPGDAFAYDIYTQVARALRVQGGDSVLGDLVPVRLLAVGESQSAFMLTTYADGIQPLALQYDGFLIHSRGRGAASLGEAGAGIDLVSSIFGEATRIRTDLAAPVMVLSSETDMLFLLKYFDARQANTDRFRSWEVAGTAHADRYLLGEVADLLECDAPVNAGPQHFVAKSALRHLDIWVRDGEPPVEAALLQIEGTPPAFARDQDGIALGGIRTPHVDVPLDTLSGAPAGTAISCQLFGSTIPLSVERIAALYASPDAYLDAYTTAADASVEAGFVLEEDRDALLAEADPSRVAP